MATKSTTTAAVGDDPTLRSSVYNQKNGRYILGGSTEVSAKFIEWWNKQVVPRDPSDVLYMLEAKYVGRLDLLAYTFYGDPGLIWIILQYNNILDPDTELIAGYPLLIPVQAKVDKHFKVNPSNVGGVPNTRST